MEIDGKLVEAHDHKMEETRENVLVVVERKPIFGVPRKGPCMATKTYNTCKICGLEENVRYVVPLGSKMVSTHVPRHMLYPRK